MSNLEGKALDEPRQLTFRAGCREQFWQRNVVAIGLSAGFLEPLESTSIHLIQQGIIRLIDAFPWHGIEPQDRDDYNGLMALEFERIRDFLILHYVANEREEPFWRQMRDSKWPESLSEKIEGFRQRGLVPEYDIGTFLPPSWIAVFAGQGVLPEGGDPRAQALDAARLADHCRSQLALVREQAGKARSHAEFLGAYAPFTPGDSR